MEAEAAAEVGVPVGFAEGTAGTAAEETPADGAAEGTAGAAADETPAAGAEGIIAWGAPDADGFAEVTKPEAGADAVEAGADAVAAGMLDAPAVTVTYTMSVTVTASPAPEDGEGVGVIVGRLLICDREGTCEGLVDELPDPKMGPTSPCTGVVMMAVRLSKSLTASDMPSCWPSAYLDSAEAVSALSPEVTSTSMQVV